MCYSWWYNALTMLPAGSLEAEELVFLRFQATGQHCNGCIVPQAVNTQSRAPKDGRNYRLKHVELIGIINKLLLLHLVGCSILDINSSFMHISRLINKIKAYTIYGLSVHREYYKLKPTPNTINYKKI